MQYRELGKTGVTVSEIGFGVWTLSTGWWGDYSDDRAVALLREALDLGVTFFDTAPSYGAGRGEELLAKAFAGQRDRIVIGTKFGYEWEQGQRPDGQREHPQDFSPAAVRRSLEGSLRRLGTDYIDFYQMHNPRLPALRRDDLFGLLDDLQREGTIRSYGAALGPAIGWREEGVHAIERRDIPALQVIHNLLEQDPGRDFIRAARETGAGLVVRVPHSSGLLEGKYTAETTFDAGDHRSHRKREWLVTGLQKLEKLRFLVDGRPWTIGQAALQWLLAEPLVASVLPNVYESGQLREFAAASDLPPLTEDDLGRVRDLFERDFYLGAGMAAVESPA